MPDEEEKTIEKVTVLPESQPEEVKDELSDADLESAAGASIFRCICVSSIVIP